jgi:hypothetical protein
MERKMKIQLSFLYSLRGTSTIKAMAKFISDCGGRVERLEETRTGFVAAVSVPGEDNSGGIYIWDNKAQSVFTLIVDNRDFDLSRAEIDKFVPQLVEHCNMANRRSFKQDRPVKMYGAICDDDSVSTATVTSPGPMVARLSAASATLAA